MSRRIAYTVKEAAELLSVSRSLVYEMIHAGAIQSIKFGRSRRITEEQILAFLGSHEVQSICPPPALPKK